MGRKNIRSYCDFIKIAAQRVFEEVLPIQRTGTSRPEAEEHQQMMSTVRNIVYINFTVSCGDSESVRINLVA